MSLDWQAWMNHAACRPGQGVDPELFHPIGTAEPAVAQTEEAKRVCAPCPVKGECLTYSLRQPGESISTGVWGEMDEDERAAEKRRRARHLAAVAS